MSDKEKEGFENEEFDSNSDDSFMLEDEKDYPGEIPAFSSDQSSGKKRSGLLIFFSVIASIILLFFVSISAYLLLFHQDDTMKLLGFGKQQEAQTEDVIDISEKLEPIDQMTKIDDSDPTTNEGIASESAIESAAEQSQDLLIPVVKEDISNAEQSQDLLIPVVKEDISKTEAEKIVEKPKKSIEKKVSEKTNKNIAKVEKKKTNETVVQKQTDTKIVKNRFVQNETEPSKTTNVEKVKTKTTNIEKVKKADSKPMKTDLAESRPKEDKAINYGSTRSNTLSSIKEQKKSVTKSGNDLYTIQIYSSPSREDAEEWLDKLKARNIVDAFISQQKIRDDLWYRVRFGKFSSREEARTIALKHGFTQTWIDKVR